MADIDQAKPEKINKGFYGRPTFWVLAIALFTIILTIGVGDESNKMDSDASSASEVTITNDTLLQERSAAEPVVTDQAKPTETVSQQNAIKKAKSYLDFAGFSRDGLVEQLEFEQFTNADAVYGADNAGADWYVEVEQKASTYIEFSSFSRQGLIDQLIFDKFTQAQAAHGADSVGL